MLDLILYHREEDQVEIIAKDLLSGKGWISSMYFISAAREQICKCGSFNSIQFNSVNQTVINSLIIH